MTNYGTQLTKKKSIKLIKSASTTLNKVLTMIDQDKYCPDILQQIESVNGLLKSIKKELLAGHLNHCLESKLEENKTKTIDELLKIYNLSN